MYCLSARHVQMMRIISNKQGKMEKEQKELLSAELDRKFGKLKRINDHVDRIILIIMLVIIAFVGSALLDNLRFLERGMGSIAYHDFDELLGINPDTVAWITLDGTKIDYPVVQGKDNFEYLDKAFDGEYYAGGTIFLDCGNKRNLSDRYNIIHGHNMAMGAMFGDLEKYLDKGFFEDHGTGKLLTPEYDYDLEITASGSYDAYDNEVYAPGDVVPVKKAIGESVLRRGSISGYEQVAALSTCSGDMNEERVVVFCRMTNKRKHE